VTQEKRDTKTIIKESLIHSVDWVRTILSSIIDKMQNKGLSKRRAIFIFLTLLAILCILIYATFNSDNNGINDLTSSENKLIEKYVNECSVEDSLGQIFMVGIPSDYNNYKDSKYIDDIFINMGIGSAIVNGYNYFNPGKYDDITFLNSIIEFNNAMQEKATKSKLSLPLLLATDFESSSFTSIKNGLTLPPSALAIGASKNPLYTEFMGKLTGFQLHNIGINIILGPVLDSYNVKQGNRTTLQDRCFASTPRGVVAIASHFIKGLKEGGVSVFAKHFPSYGSVEENPHDFTIPIYEGSSEQLMGEIKPFVYFKNSIDGIMTSHIVLSRMKNKMATFSEEFINDHLRSLGFNDQIIITDDLTSMGAIIKYSQTQKEGFKDIAIKAFAAGHDVLLFSHFSEIDKRSSFSVQDLREVRAGLLDYIINNKQAEKKFRQSLKRVITQKAKIAKSMGCKVDDLLSKQKTMSFFHIPYNAHDALDRSQIFLKNQDIIINTGDKLVKEIISKAATVINEKASYNLNAYPTDSKILFFTYEEGAKYFRESIGPIYKNAEFIIVPILKNSNSFQQLRKKIISNFNKTDLIIYTVFDKSDSDLLSYVQKLYNKSFSSKVIILCHNSPIIFDNNILSEATIVSTFTNHPFSYEVDSDILINKNQPNKLKDLPISIGENGKIYNVVNTVFIQPTDPASYENLFPKYLVDEKTLKIIEDSNYMISKVQAKKIAFVVLNFILISFFLIAFAKTLSKLIVKINEGDFFVTLPQLLTTTFFKNPYLIIPIIIGLLMNRFCFRGEALQAYEIMKNFIPW
jgi:beta-N-acetylhexosaminidase